MSTMKNFTIISCAVLMIAIATNVHPYICANGSGGGYTEPEGSTQSSTVQFSNMTIEMHVIEGAKYFLEANSDIMTFLNRVEDSDISGMDLNEAGGILDSALQNMQYAAATYDCLVWLAEGTPYNDGVIARLLEFDYNGYMNEHGLNSVIFGTVESYLGRGDITGMYKHIQTRFNAMIGMLTSMRNTVSAGNVPNLSQCWELGEAVSQTLVFGQYVSRVFLSL